MKIKQKITEFFKDNPDLSKGLLYNAYKVKKYTHNQSQHNLIIVAKELNDKDKTKKILKGIIKQDMV